MRLYALHGCHPAVLMGLVYALANNTTRCAKMLPRVVASPGWQGAPQNDFVGVLQATDAGTHASSDIHKLYLTKDLTSPSMPK